MDIVLLVLCVIFFMVYLIWFFLGQERWSKLPALIVDFVLILACLGLFAVIFIFKGRNVFGESFKDSIIEESTVTDGNLAVPVDAATSEPVSKTVE